MATSAGPSLAVPTTVKGTFDRSKEFAKRMDDLHVKRNQELAERAGYTDEAWDLLQEIKDKITHIEGQHEVMENMANRCREVNEEVDNILRHQEANPPQVDPETEEEENERMKKIALRAFGKIVNEPTLPLSFISQWGSQFDDKLQKAVETHFEPMNAQHELEIKELQDQQISQNLRVQVAEGKVVDLKSELANVQVKYNECKKHLKIANQKVTQWNRWEDEAMKLLETKRQEIRKLKGQLDQNVERDERVLELEEKLADAQQQCRETEAALITAQEQGSKGNTYLEKKLETEQHRVRKYSSEIGRLNGQVEDLTSRLEEEEQASNTLETELNGARAEAAKNKKALNDWYKYSKSLQETVNDQKKKYSEAYDILKQNQISLRRMRALNGSLQNQLRVAEENLASANEMVINRAASVDRAISENEDQVLSLSAERDGLILERDQLAQRLADAEAQVKIEQENLGTERNETFELGLKVDNQAADLAKKESQLLQERDMKIEAENKVLELEQTLKSKNDELESIRGGMSQIQASTSLFLVGLTGCSMSQEQGAVVVQALTITSELSNGENLPDDTWLLDPTLDGQAESLAQNSHVDCLALYIKLSTSTLGDGLEATRLIQKAIGGICSCTELHSGLRQGLIGMITSSQDLNSLMVCLPLWQLVQIIVARWGIGRHDEAAFRESLEHRLAEREAKIFNAIINDKVVSFCKKDPLSEPELHGDRKGAGIIVMPDQQALLVITSRRLRWVSLSQLDMTDYFRPVIHVPEGDDIAIEWEKGDVGYSLNREQVRRNA